jgi:adenylyl cyclase-associated protein
VIQDLLYYIHLLTSQYRWSSDPKQVAWARSFIALIEELQKYVKQYHTTGVTWNPKVCHLAQAPHAFVLTVALHQGVPASQYKSQASSTDAAKSAPPPPPGPAPSASTSAPAPGGPGGFLAELNKGTAVTSGLKKVDPTMQTHKNPNLRASSVVTDKCECSFHGFLGRSHS